MNGVRMHYVKALKILQGKHSHTVLLALVTLLFQLSVPLPSFPLNDDYPYYKTVENILHGDVRLHHPINMTFLLQGFYGAVVASVAGLSHSSLAAGTILLSTAGIMIFYALLRRFFDRTVSTLGALTLLVNPFYFYLSHTFMTDIPRLALSLLSVYFFVRSVETKRRTYVTLGVLSALAAFWVRQFGIFTIGGLVLYYLFDDRKQLLTRRNAILLFALPATMIVTWLYWYYAVNGSAGYTEGYFNVGLNVLRTIGKGALHAGYFIFPLGAFYLFNYRTVRKKFFTLERSRKTFVALMLLAMAGFAAAAHFFLGYNAFYQFSLMSASRLGIKTIPGIKPNGIFPEALAGPLTLLSIAAFVGVLVDILSVRRGDKRFRLLSFVMVAEVVPLLFTMNFFERYFLLLIPIMTLFALRSLSRHVSVKRILVAYVLLFGALSWYGTYDNMSWNSARWEGVGYLRGIGVAEEKIDAGFEYNARFYETCIQRPELAVRWQSWACSLSDAYVVSFEQQPGYDVLHRVAYYGPFGERLGDVLVLKKNGAQ